MFNEQITIMDRHVIHSEHHDPQTSAFKLFDKIKILIKYPKISILFFWHKLNTFSTKKKIQKKNLIRLK